MRMQHKMSRHAVLSRHLLVYLMLVLCFVTQSAAGQVQANSDEASPAVGTPENNEDTVESVATLHMMPELQPPLKCSACGAIVERAVHLLRPAIETHLELRGRNRNGALPEMRLKEHETIDAYEELCSEVAKVYALEMMKDGTPSLFFSSSDEVQRVWDEWIPFFLSTTCEELLDDHEDLLSVKIIKAAVEAYEASREKKSTAALNIALQARMMVCIKWEKYAAGCDSRGFPLDPRKPQMDDL